MLKMFQIFKVAAAVTAVCALLLWSCDKPEPEVQLTVKAQGVQSENNPIQNNDTTTAAGWPAE